MNEQELRDAFVERIPLLQAFGDFVADYITEAIRDRAGESAFAKFFQIPCKPRVKELDSFLEKALVRKRKQNPLDEITDQVGVRFVVLLLEDIDRVCKIVETGPWGWQKDRDFESERLQNPDYFAYQSDHYVVRSRNETVFRGVSIPGGIACEVQIRTILQHAYAEMAHSSSYKPPVKLPEEEQRRVNRSLAKGSALIETTDEVFREIKSRLHEYSASTLALLAQSSELYASLTGQQVPTSTSLGNLVVEVYRDMLKGTQPEQIKEWVNERSWLAEQLKKKRVESVFYRDPVLPLLGLLITEHELEVPTRWPVDATYLEEFYTMLGLSTQGLF